MSAERLEQAGLNRAWISAEAALPLEWQIDGMTRIERDGEGPVAALLALEGGMRVRDEPEAAYEREY